MNNLSNISIVWALGINVHNDERLLYRHVSPYTRVSGRDFCGPLIISYTLRANHVIDEDNCRSNVGDIRNLDTTYTIFSSKTIV
jgi:hypothetical protein